ncbi:hypothetical protein [Streptomyces sp. NPDC059916]|uniref:hypothetical protein n=1 Tax=Streptomyces sp. NPDC059916 TaxID=3347001 RepID=UPI0036A0B6EF
MIRLRHALPAVLLLATLTACGTTAPAATPATATVTATPAVDSDTPPADDEDTTQTDADMTQAIVDLTWDSSSETEKQNMCDGIDLFGTEWAADQLREGGGDSGLDWDRAAEIIEGKCQQR